MAYKRYIVELGSAADLHGGDVTLAAQRAAKDAISHCCLCGLSDILQLKDNNAMKIDMLVYVPYPERVDKEEVKKMLPFGEVNITVVEGGLKVRGLHVAEMGEGDDIVVANVALTVWVDV